MEVDDAADTSPSCTGCSACLLVPYIRCADCHGSPVELCLHCFAQGWEFAHHKSDHRYLVIKNDFPVFEKDWTAADEIKLLEAVSECGLGNWNDVAHIMQNKSRQSCEAHYTKCYIEAPLIPVPDIPDPARTLHPCPVPFRPTDDPPRPSEGTTLQAELSGYMPARGDFAVEYDNYAEMDLRDIDFRDEDSALHTETKLAAVDVYRNVILERARRKRIIKHCGLINIKKNIVYNRRLERTLGCSVLDTLRTFQRMLPSGDWDMFIESWHYEVQLRQTIMRLQQYREAGLRSVYSARIYDRLRAHRAEQRGKLHLLTDLIQHMEDKSGCQLWLKKQAALSNISKGELVPVPNAARRFILPLDIMGLPGYEKLTDKEREMCSIVRLVPQSYLDFKAILMSECRKVGFLRLAQARSIIKIDVNKTRKIYDFLLEEGHIYKDPIVK